MAEKPRFRRRTVFAKNLGFGVGFGYRNNTILHISAEFESDSETSVVIYGYRQFHALCQ